MHLERVRHTPSATINGLLDGFRQALFEDLDDKLDERAKAFAPLGVTFKRVVDFDDEVQLALTYRIRECSPCVKAFVGSVLSLNESREIVGQAGKFRVGATGTFPRGVGPESRQAIIPSPQALTSKCSDCRIYMAASGISEGPLHALMRSLPT